MNILVKLANVLTGIVGAGAENLTGNITGILPNVMVLLTMINAIIALIGEDKVNAFAMKITKYRICRYTIIPFLSLFFFTNPMCYTMARFVEDKYRPATVDAIFKMAHPITGIFPHANSGELFVWLGISSGLTTLGQSTTPLAVRYLLVGFVVCLISGICSETITLIMLGQSTKKNK